MGRGAGLGGQGWGFVRISGCVGGVCVALWRGKPGASEHIAANPGL